MSAGEFESGEFESGETKRGGVLEWGYFKNGRIQEWKNSCVGEFEFSSRKGQYKFNKNSIRDQ